MSTQVAVKEQTEVSTKSAQAPRYSAEQVAAADISNQSSLPSLAGATKHFMPLSIEYWKPQVDGEEKLVYIAGVDYHDVPAFDKSGDITSMMCVLMLEQKENELCRYINASKILVGNISGAIDRGEIIPMTLLTPVSIRFLGKKPAGNGNMVARWQIIPLIVAA